MPSQRTLSKFLAGVAVSLCLGAGGSAVATPVNINVSGAFSVATGTLADLLGRAFIGGFSYDTAGATTNDAFGSPADGGTGQELGTEFTGGSATPSIPSLGEGFTSPTLVAELENNVTRTAGDLLNLLPDGTYDFFSLNGWSPDSSFVPGGTTINEQGADTGVNFGLTFIAAVDSGFVGTLSDPSAEVPPATFASAFPTAIDLSQVDFVVVTVEEYVNQSLVGLAYQFGTIGEGGTFENFEIVSAEAVPEPGAIVLFGLGLTIVLIRFNRPRRAI